MCFDICTINIRVSIRVRGLHLVFFFFFSGVLCLQYSMHIHMYRCIQYISTYIYTYTYLYIYIYIHIHIYIYTQWYIHAFCIQAKNNGNHGAFPRLFSQVTLKGGLAANAYAAYLLQETKENQGDDWWWWGPSSRCSRRKWFHGQNMLLLFLIIIVIKDILEMWWVFAIVMIGVHKMIVDHSSPYFHHIFAQMGESEQTIQAGVRQFTTGHTGYKAELVEIYMTTCFYNVYIYICKIYIYMNIWPSVD